MDSTQTIIGTQPFNPADLSALPPFNPPLTPTPQPLAAPTAISVPDLGLSCVYVSFSAGYPPFRKLDKDVSEEVDAAKNTRTRAGNYHKKLLGDCPTFDRIVKFVANTRNRIHYKLTKPWGDGDSGRGLRVTTTEIFLNEYVPKMSAAENEYWQLVQEFLDEYDTFVSAAAFQLQDLFNRDDYPPKDKVAKKFHWSYAPCPVPNEDDFRIQAGRDAVALIKTQYQTHYEECIKNIQSDNWKQLHEVLTNMSERLAVNGETKTIFRDTLISNAVAACNMLKGFNVNNDPALEAARLKLEETLYGVSADALREDLGLRHDVKSKVDSILKDMDW